MLVSLVRLGLVLLIALIFSLTANPARAANAVRGARVFEVNCAVCHAGGGNQIKSAKTLKLNALEKYGMNSLEAIKQQVVDGKNAMPAFGSRLSDSEIEDVAAYVLSQAELGW